MYLAATGDEVRYDPGTTFGTDELAPAFAYLVLQGRLAPAAGQIPQPRFPSMQATNELRNAPVLLAVDELSVLVIPTRLLYGVLRRLPWLDGHLVRAQPRPALNAVLHAPVAGQA